MTEQQKKVNALIERIEAHQKALGWKDDKFARQFRRHLGSPKSWTHRLKPRNWAEIGGALPKWESRLRAFVTEIETGAAADVEFFDALPIWKYSEGVFDLLAGQRNDRRCAWLIAPTGCGKSWSMTKLAAQNLESAAYLHAVPGWKDSIARIAEAFARAVGSPVMPGGAQTFDRVLGHLKGQPMTLLLDDVHEGGVTMLKLIKTLIDETRARFILGSYPTGYYSLVNANTSAMSEAQQLFGRSLKPVQLAWSEGIRPEDAAAYISAAVSAPREAVLAVAERICNPLRRGGNLRTLADAVELSRENADEGGEDPTLEMIETAVLQLCPERVQRKK